MPTHPSTSPDKVSLEDLLTSRRVAFTVQDGRVEVQGDLWIHSPQDVVMPQHVTVRGDMQVLGSGLSRLPASLVVDGNLILLRTRLRSLPKDLSVGREISITNTPLWALPPGLRVPKHLHLSHTRVSHLPKDLYVGGDMDIRNTDVVRIHKSVHVGGVITPPVRLRDLEAFMAHQPGDVVLFLYGSAHQRLLERTRLQDFPELWRVLVSVRPLHRLRIARESSGLFYTRFEPLIF